MLVGVPVALIVSVVLYLLVSTWYGHDWWRLFYHTFIGSVVDISRFEVPFSLDLYANVVGTQLTRVIIGNFVVVTVILPFLLLSLLTLLRSRSKSDALRLVVLIGYFNFVFYCFMFPLVEGWDRFFIPFYIFIVVLAARTAAPTPTIPAASTTVLEYSRETSV